MKTGPRSKIVRDMTAAASIFAAALALSVSAAHAKDKLLDEVTDFTGTVLFLETKVPAARFAMAKRRLQVSAR
jgi:hypothetical protein